MGILPFLFCLSASEHPLRLVAVDEQSLHGVPGVEVTLRSLDTEQSRTTDELGSVQFESLGQGSLEIVVRKNGYLRCPDSAIYESRWEERDAPLVLCLTKSATLAGKVQRSDGVPVKGAIVSAIPQTPDGPLDRERVVTAADDDGRYRISGLTPGAFTVHAQTEWYQSDNLPMHAFFPGTPNRDFARIVELAGGEVFDRADVVAPVQSSGSIKGRIVDAAGASSGAAFLVAVLPRNGSRSAFKTVQADRNAAFQLDDIPFGDYELLVVCGNGLERAEPACADGRAVYGRALIAVSAEESVVEVHVKPMMTLRLGIEVQGGSCQNIEALTLKSLEEWPGAWSPKVRRIGTGLEISMIVPGSYSLSYADEEMGCVLMGLVISGQEMPRRIVHVEETAAREAGTIRFAATATLKLRLDRLGSNPSDCLLAVRSNRGPRFPSAILLAGAAGEYSIAPLVPAEYRIFAACNAKDTAVSVVLSPGEKKTLSVALVDRGVQ